MIDKRSDDKEAISSSILPQELPWRFIRLHPRFETEETLDLLRRVDHIPSILRVPWCLSSDPSSAAPTPSLPFYAIPGATNLPSTTCYQMGRIYGQDVSSGQAVAVLLEDLQLPDGPQHHIRLLDLCASPGLKLCAMADLCFSRGCTNVTIIGVDIDRHRLHLCQRLLQKYQTSSSKKNVHIQLYWGDGTTWGRERNDHQRHELVYDSRLVAEEHLRLQEGQKRRNKSARHRERKLLRDMQQAEATQEVQLFDYVLVDAECSSDGSLSHRCGGAGSDQRDALVALQSRLLQRGFALLRPGGNLVYATCSLEDAQNSGVVERLLSIAETARIVPLHWHHHGSTDPPPSTAVMSGRLAGTIQFLPSSDDALFGSGLFVAKLKRRVDNDRDR